MLATFPWAVFLQDIFLSNQSIQGFAMDILRSLQSANCIFDFDVSAGQVWLELSNYLHPREKMHIIVLETAWRLYFVQYILKMLAILSRSFHLIKKTRLHDDFFCRNV